MEKLIVTNKYNGKKLDKFILENLPYISLNTFYKLLRKKDIKVNGKRINENLIVNLNDEIFVYLPSNFSKNINTLNIIYEDDNILLINKPANIEVTGPNSLTELAHKNYHDTKFAPMPCHRLDRNTAGLVLFAKNLDSLDILTKKFKNHEIKKHYLALVYGVPKKKFEKLQAYLFKDSKKSMVYISDVPKKGYKNIITLYTLLKRYDNGSSLLDVEIETGRTHQIRAHLAHIGCPIIGDGKYGINQINKRFGFKCQQLFSYKLMFNFNLDAGMLNYLNHKTFELPLNLFEK